MAITKIRVAVFIDKRSATVIQIAVITLFTEASLYDIVAAELVDAQARASDFADHIPVVPLFAGLLNRVAANFELTGTRASVVVRQVAVVALFAEACLDDVVAA